MGKVLTVRLSDNQVAELESLASFDGVALAAEIREAISLLISARKGDEKFKQRVRDSFDRARRKLEQLEGTDEVIKALGDPTKARIHDTAQADLAQHAVAGAGVD